MDTEPKSDNAISDQGPKSALILSAAPLRETPLLSDEMLSLGSLTSLVVRRTSGIMFSLLST